MDSIECTAENLDFYEPPVVVASKNSRGEPAIGSSQGKVSNVE